MRYLLICFVVSVDGTGGRWDLLYRGPLLDRDGSADDEQVLFRQTGQWDAPSLPGHGHRPACRWLRVPLPPATIQVDFNNAYPPDHASGLGSQGRRRVRHQRHRRGRRHGPLHPARRTDRRHAHRRHRGRRDQGRSGHASTAYSGSFIIDHTSPASSLHRSRRAMCCRPAT